MIWVLKYIEVIRAIDTVSDVLQCACVRRSADVEVNHSLGQCTCISVQVGLNLERWLRMDHLETLQVCESVLSGNHTIISFLERMTWT